MTFGSSDANRSDVYRNIKRKKKHESRLQEMGEWPAAHKHNQHGEDLSVFFSAGDTQQPVCCSPARASGGVSAGGWDFPPLAPIIALSIGDVSGSDRRRLIAASSLLLLAWPTNWVSALNVLLSLSDSCRCGRYASLDTAVDAPLVEVPSPSGPHPLPLRAAQVDLSDM